MKKIFIIGILVCFASCFSGILTNAQALDVNTLFTALKSELGSKIVAANDINAAEQPIKNLLGMGASLAEVKSALLDFIGKGFKGSNLGSLVSLVSDLMKNGEAIKGATNIVSRAIKQASAMGLKGEGLVARVQGIVGQKKALGSLFGK